MGQKISDGKAFDVNVPSSAGLVTVTINDYDLYRVGGLNGVAIGARAIGDTNPGIALEADTNAIYSVKCPSGIAPTPGDVLFWADQTATTNSVNFQKGDTNLVTEPPVSGDQACFFVTRAKNAAGYIQGRVLNGVPSPTGVVS